MANQSSTKVEKKKKTKAKAEGKKETKEKKQRQKKKGVEDKKPKKEKKPLKEEIKEEEKPPADKEKKDVEKPEEKKKIIEKIAYRIKRDTEALKKRRKKPKFLRQEFYKFKRLDEKWRTPRGSDSKKDEDKRGKGKSPKIGYGNPPEARGIHPTGFYPVIVRNPSELKLINPTEQGAIIASEVGRKKRNEIIKAANELRIMILNPRKGEL